MNSEKKKVAVITGGAQGIGLAIAEMFIVRHGFSVAICGRTAATMKIAKRHLEKLIEGNHGPDIYCEVIDIGTSNNAQMFIERAAAALGGIDILVNNAAHVVKKSFNLMTIADVEATAGTNVLAPWVCSLSALPYLFNSDIHTIINMSSEMDETPLPQFTAYSSSKGGITSFTKSLAADFPASKLRVIGIRPRRVDTPLWHRVRTDDRSRYVPEDVANLVEYAVFTLSQGDTGKMLNLKDHGGL